MKKIIGAIVVIVVVILIIALSGGSKGETGPIKIGFIGPLTGDAASIGQNVQAAVQIAVDELNVGNGKKIEVIYEDGKCTGSNASSAANKLINIDKVSVILGGACSGETMAFTQVAEQAKVPVLSYCSSNPAITTAGDYIFRNYPSDTYQGSFVAGYLFDKLGKKKAAIIYAKTDWANGIKDVFSAEFKKLGGQVVNEEGFDPASKDIRSLISRIKANNPDVIYFLGYTDQTVFALKQFSDLGLKAQLFGGDAWADAKLWVDAGATGEGAMYASVSSKNSEAFKAAMLAKTGTNEIGGCSPTAYDGLKLISQVINKVGGNSGDIKNELYKTEYVGGVSSDTIKFDQNGDLVGANYSVMKVQKGVAAPVTE